MGKVEKAKAGHQEIHGETIAKFEFFDHGFNPYSRYLDVDKVDLILRQRVGDAVQFIEVQVKYGRLYLCSSKVQAKNFDVTSWRFFKLNEFADSPKRLYIAYVLVHPEGYRGDIFIIPALKFNQLIHRAVRSNTKKGAQAQVCIAHCIHDDKWYLWRKMKFEKMDDTTVVDVTEYRRNFLSLSTP